MFSPFGIGNFDVLGDGEGFVTLDEAKQLIKDSLVAAKEDGSFDDTKVYRTYEDMISNEPVGREDVLYIIETDDNVHGTRYLWTGSEYEPIQDTITSEDISSIVV